MSIVINSVGRLTEVIINGSQPFTREIKDLQVTKVSDTHVQIIPFAAGSIAIADITIDGAVPSSYSDLKTKLALVFPKANSGEGGSVSDLDDVPDSATRLAFLSDERTKLTGIATGATANSSDATLLARANHTGTQLASTISDFNAAALAAAPAETTTTEGALINGASDKATPVDADHVGLMDSAAANILKKLSWSNIKATILSYLISVRQPQFLFLTSGTTWTTDANITAATVFKITMVGGGGGGGGMNTTNGKAPGGGGGAALIKFITGLSPSTGYTYAIGAGGGGGAATPAAGGAGGDTTLTIGATTYTAGGGAGGPETISTAGGTGGTAINGDININGQNGDGTGAASAATSGSRGGSPGLGFGVGGGGQDAGGNGFPGTGYGAGGGGAAHSAASGGAGTQGAILIEWT